MKPGPGHKYLHRAPLVHHAPGRKAEEEWVPLWHHPEPFSIPCYDHRATNLLGRGSIWERLRLSEGQGLNMWVGWEGFGGS